ncbi:MAG: hypothetical protein KJO26_15545 [Deltaproteobacteria bacterium]|nr:hypothetical protein [Deltaproteobacteria bacterium]
MGISLKAFIIDDDDIVHRITYAMYKRLVAQAPDACLKQYTDRRVRYALIAVEMKDGKPKDILHTEEGFFTFDSGGRLDLSSRKEEIKLVYDSLTPHEKDKSPKQIVEARHHFAKKEYEDKYTWKPTPQIAETIIRMIFGK